MTTRDLGIKLSNIDPQEVIRLGKIVERSPVDQTTPEEVQLVDMASAYFYKNGLLENVPGLDEYRNARILEEARKCLTAYTPKRNPCLGNSGKHC